MNAHLDPREIPDAPALSVTPPGKVLRLQGQAFIVDPSGVLYWSDERLLIVADLHFEKGSAYATRRVFLPPYDTSATLDRLAAAVRRFAPRRIVALGDSFHDCGGAGRLQPQDARALGALQAGRDWVWIAGNHDPQAPANDAGLRLAGEHAQELEIGPIRFRHEPSVSPCDGEIAGHLHPSVIVGGRGGVVRRRCFLADDRRCILPAFGAYAGGLNILDIAFRRLFGAADPYAHVLGRAAVYTVRRSQCLADTNAVGTWR
jgi:DNA ligase-associated metallophosphoesterase